MEMKGFGPAILENLMETNLVKTIFDLYGLMLSELKEIGMGEKTADTVLQAIGNSAKDVSLGKFIFALGIPGVGKSTAENLAAHLLNPVKLYTLKESDLAGLPESGEKTKQDIFNYLSKVDVKIEIKDMVEQVMTFKLMESTVGKEVFVITGTLSVGRKEFAELITKAGGVVSDTLSKKVNYLVAGEDCGGKLEKAQKLGVKVISEEEARKLLKVG
jgi:DNA ligase (NAD+)